MSCWDILPDEILLMICQSLTSAEALLSFDGLNERLSRIVRDPFLMKRLSFERRISSDSSIVTFHRLCCDVLPVIGEKIYSLQLDSSIMQNILCAAYYPNLHDLALWNITEPTIYALFHDDRFSSATLKNRIENLVIGIDPVDDDLFDNAEIRSLLYIYETVFTVFYRLTSLAVVQPSYKYHARLSFDDGPLYTFCSSNLVKLRISLEEFSDCLHIFDGRFGRLEYVDVDIGYIRRSRFIQNKFPLPRMKHLMINSERMTYDFEETILPLLSRMSNLDELHLYLKVHLSHGFIDKPYLKSNVLSRLPKLQHVGFHLHSYQFNTNDSATSPMEEKGDFITLGSSVCDIASYADCFPEKNETQYHLYTSPCLTNHFHDISHRLLDGTTFKSVRRVSLYDEKAFDHQFFVRIAKSFPLMQHLSVVNSKPQQRQQSDQTTTNNAERVPLIRWDHLKFLDLSDVHDHYIEQFLLDDRSCFVQEMTLSFRSSSFDRIIQQLTEDQIKLNSNRVRSLWFFGLSRFSNDIQKYFPRGKITAQFGGWLSKQSSM